MILLIYILFIQIYDFRWTFTSKRYTFSEKENAELGGFGGLDTPTPITKCLEEGVTY